MRNIHKNIAEKFEPQQWCVTEKKFALQTNKINETIFSIGNGFLGMRGFLEEGLSGNPEYTESTTMINGFYEYFDYNHIWCRPGFPKRYHCILNQVNPAQIIIFVDGEKIQTEKNIENYNRVLNMYRGTVTRSFTYITKANKRVNLVYERFASMAEKHLLAFKLKVYADSDCDLKIISVFDGNISETNNRKAEMGSDQNSIYTCEKLYVDSGCIFTLNSTKRSKLSVQACMTDNLIKADKSKVVLETNKFENITELKIAKDTSFEYKRLVVYTTSLEGENFEEVGKNILSKCAESGYDKLLKAHEKEWEKIWKESDVTLADNLSLQQAVRYSIFMLNQSVGKDGKTNISANGLTGTGYMGHTFWDTEIFMFPLFLFTQPETAKELLIYRYNILDKARERAKQMDDQGALFAWNSINGEECGHVFEAATAQYHINCDIFYAIYNYMQVTDDKEFMLNYGAEILFEITKCIAHRGNFIPLKDNKFCINVVCGPDEYSPNVDNNCYTNMLAKMQLEYTYRLAGYLQENEPKLFYQLCEKCDIDENEIKQWKKASDQMYIPYHKGLGIYMQDDQFLYRDPIDIESIPESKLPLLTHLHPLNLWRYQVAKQADIVLLTVLRKNEFTPEMRKKIFDYYEPKTIHDSSLSAGIHAIAACDIGYMDEAYGYFRQTARMDLDNVNRNTFFGIHSACMGATYMVILYGYAGMFIEDGRISFAPKYDSAVGKYSFKINFKGRLLKVTVKKGEVEYELVKGDNLEIIHYGKKVQLISNTANKHDLNRED